MTANDRTHTNWGRWGDDDQRGAINMIDEDKRRAAARCVREGRMYSLAHPMDGAIPRTPGRHAPWHTLSITRKRGRKRGSAGDILTVDTHTGTHMDALCHYWGDEGLYNGFDHQEIASAGAPWLGVHNVGGIVTRALLVDVSSSCPAGEEGWGHEVLAADIETELDRAGLAIEPGDAVLLHTGWAARFPADREVYAWGEPGIGPAAAEWLARQDVVLVGADNWAVEAVPPAVKGEGLPVHRTLLNRYGIYILENLVLGDAARNEGTSVGLLTVAPILIRGGAGSPVNPIFVC